MITYYGIKTPGNPDINQEPYIWWISNSEYGAWRSFFQHPSKTDEVMPHRLPVEEAIRAYEGIGYKCVELEVKELNG